MDICGWLSLGCGGVLARSFGWKLFASFPGGLDAERGSVRFVSNGGVPTGLPPAEMFIFVALLCTFGPAGITGGITAGRLSADSRQTGRKVPKVLLHSLGPRARRLGQPDAARPSAPISPLWPWPRALVLGSPSSMSVSVVGPPSTQNAKMSFEHRASSGQLAALAAGGTSASSVSSSSHL